MRIRTPGGAQVPLLSVADITYEPGFSTIRRTNGKRTVTVTAYANTRIATANEIFDELSEGFFRDLASRYPDLTVVLKGDKKRSRESMGSLKIGFPIAMMGIFTIVATMFRSYLQPFVIMITIPFGIIGAVLGHYVLGHSLSMMSLFGMVALTGWWSTTPLCSSSGSTKTWPGISRFSKRCSGAGPAVPGHISDHPEYGGGTCPHAAGNGSPGPVSHPHGGFPGLRGVVCHPADPGVYPGPAGDFQRRKTGGPLAVQGKLAGIPDPD
jgi:hypothetical protein